MKRLTVLCVAALFIYKAHAQSQIDAKTAENLEFIIKGSNYNDGWLAEMENVMKERVAALIKDKPISASMQTQIDTASSEMMATMRERLSFDKMKPGIIQATIDTFTVNEIASLRKLYESEEWKLLEAKRRSLRERNVHYAKKIIEPAIQAMEQRMLDLKATLAKD